MFFEINPYHIDTRLIKETAVALSKGKLAIIPTDSVYAVVCDLHHKKALKALSKFKGEREKRFRRILESILANASTVCISDFW